MIDKSSCEAGTLERQGDRVTYWVVSCGFCRWSNRERSVTSDRVVDTLAMHVAQHHRIERPLDWSWMEGGGFGSRAQVAHLRQENQRLREQLVEVEARYGPGRRLWPFTHRNAS